MAPAHSSSPSFGRSKKQRNQTSGYRAMQYDEWRGSLDGRPTLWVKRFLSWRGWRVDLHKMVGADDADCFHTHPATAFRLVLWGGYVEEIEDGRWRFWFPGRFGIVRPALCHRIAGLRNGRASFSLWIRAPKSAAVELRGDGWKQQDETHRAPNTVFA